MNHPKLKLIAAAVTLACSLPAFAVLERVGPNNPAPSVGNFPSWYQDTSGLTLEFCDPKNQLEVDGGWCLLLPGDVVAPPETFPTNFFDEHFYFAASALLTAANGGKAGVVLAVESAFANGAAVPGDQIAFSRIRVRLTDVPATGSYRFIHPYGEEIQEGVAGGRIFFTDDVGITCPPGQFDCALQSRLGPFLLPSVAPGGPEMPALTAANPTPDVDPAHFGGVFAATPYPGNGASYIADPSRIGPVTGSALPNFIDSTGQSRNHNIFRVEGPVGSNLGGPGIDFIETTDFSLMGRVFTGAVPGKFTADRASYARNASGQKVDVFATAFPTTQVRLPTQPTPAAAPPNLSFYDVPCAGVVDPATGEIGAPFSAPVGATAIPMANTAPSLFWAQALPAALPATVCIADASAVDAGGNPVTAYHSQRVIDEVDISSASYDPATSTLTIAATSSDQTVPPTLSAVFGSFRGDLVNGQLAVPAIPAPPANVAVLSSAQGSNTAQVRTAFPAPPPPPPPPAPVASNDAYTVAADAGPVILDLLANDTDAAGGTVALASAPTLGGAVVNADGTVTYTPGASGAESFTYTVTVGGQTSNAGTVTIDVTPVAPPPPPVNSAPVAVNDSASGITGNTISINLLANDSDPDGAADLAGVTNVSASTPAGATIGITGGTASFSAAVAGSYSFTYQAVDVAGALSEPATVSVQVAAATTVRINKAEFVRSIGNLRVEGNVIPAGIKTLTLEFVNAAGTVLGSPGTVNSTATGFYRFDQSGLVLPAGATALKVTAPDGGTRTSPIALK